MTQQTQEDSARQVFMDLGYSFDVVEALIGNEVSVETVQHMSADEVFDMFLSWNGIIGYGSMISSGLDNIKKVKGEGE